MNLTLEIVSPNGQSLGPARRKVFGPEGGRIGRAPDCDWVIPNPYISRHHATIRWISGTYYIESTGENGVAINTPQAMIPQRERRPLRNGDRLFLDEYEITVGIGVEGAQASAGGPMSFAPADDPLTGLLATARQPVLPDPLDPSHDDLDPLKQLGGSRGAPSAPLAEVNWNHTPGLRDQFTPPSLPSGAIPDDWQAPTPHTTAPGGAQIPDDWDKTSFNRPGTGAVPDQQSPAGRGPAAEVPAPGGMRSRGTPLPLRPAPAGQGGPPPMRPTPASPGGPHTPAQRTPDQQVPAWGTPTPPSPVQQTTQPQTAQQYAPRQMTVPQAAGPQPALPGAEFDVTALFRAAGVDPATIPPETASSLGLILRTVVQGVIEVLQARAEIKTQFRLPLTRIKTTENNPLKFSVNAEDALNSLLGRRSSAYLPPVEAFEDAFDDIRFHQMAMLAGIRAGFEHAMQRFAPQHLQEMFDKRVKRGGLLQMATKSRYWELYAEEFRELTGDPDDAFKRLFGEVFAVTYEQQLEELKRARRKPPR